MLPGAGDVGEILTVTVVTPAVPVHPPTVTLTEYVPALAVVTLEIVGSSKVEVKLFGPVQL